MGNLATGSASFSINSQETEARLVFTPDPDGEGWDIAAINKLASEHQLGAFPDTKVMEAFLSKAARAKTLEQQEMVYAQGIEPQEPINEKIEWAAALPVPGDIFPFQAEALGKAAPPKVFKVKVEKIKHETKVNKPGALPFMSGKEEITVNWEKKETQEKVAVNPKVLEVKYANRGTKLGVVLPSSPGKAGKNIFGRPIPPPEAEDGTYFLGEGISRDKNEFSAGVSGFIRIGENWADIVPLAKHIWKINTGTDGLTLFFHFEPGDPRFPLPTGEEILAAAMEKGADKDSLVCVKELDKEISEAAKHREPLEAFALFQVREAEARVDISQDKTRAVLFLRKGVAGALPLEMKAISQAIKDSKVQGYDSEQLKATIHTFMDGKDLVLSDYVLVEGTPSTRGKDREVQVRVPLLSAEESKPVLSRLKEWHSRDVSEDVEFDPNKEMRFAFVEKGALIASVSAFSQGESGKDIYGNEIPGLPGNDPDIKLCRGLGFYGDEIKASKSGLLLVEAKERSFWGEVLDWQDAKIGIHIAEDVMEVKGDFFREEGAGSPLTLVNVKKALEALGVKRGINWQGVEEACVIARVKGSVLGHVIAKGVPPWAKGDSAFKWLVPMNSPDDNDTSRLIQVNAGTPIAVFSEPLAAGRPGYDVKGTEIPVEKATAQSIKHDDSIRKEPYGKGHRLIAIHSGDLRYEGGGLKIISVKNIDGDTEDNLKFPGEIRVSGNLLPGCMAMAGSNVIVDGFAEEALVSAGGKVVAAMGIKGGGRGIIRAKDGIEADYSERASLVAMGDIKLKKGSMLSIIRTNGKVSIADEDGKLSGGICHARYGIEAANIGSEKGHITEISFGQDYFVKEKINAYEENIIKAKEELSKIEKKIENLQNNEKPLPDALVQEKVRLMKVHEHLIEETFNLREKFEEHYDSEVLVHGIVYPGVVFESHNRYHEIMQKRNGVIFYFDRKTGRIKERPVN